MLVEEGGFLAAWVGYAETGEAKRILPIAVMGAEQSEIAAMNLAWEDNEHGHGSTGTAIRTGFGIFPALQEISWQKGKLFDMAVVEACQRLFMEKNYELQRPFVGVAEPVISPFPILPSGTSPGYRQGRFYAFPPSQAFCNLLTDTG